MAPLNNIVQQDKTQAAENNSSPPVSVSRLKAGALEISYTMGVQDWIAAYRIGTTQFRPAPARIAAIGVILLLLALMFLIAGQGLEKAWHHQGTFPWHYVLTVLPLAGLGLPVFAVLMPLALRSVSTRKVTLQNRIITVSTKTGNIFIQWRCVYGVYKDVQHIAISSGGFDALVVPVRAFSNEQAATAFFDTAVNFWHEAKGTLPPPAPETAGVWPPAPRPANSAEPSDGPEC